MFATTSNPIPNPPPPLLSDSNPPTQFLAAANILPSNDQTYASADIQAALSAPRGHPVTIRCRNGALDEIWYHFDVAGSVQTGQFVPSDPG